jgi:hypothetical protein
MQFRNRMYTENRMVRNFTAAKDGKKIIGNPIPLFGH